MIASLILLLALGTPAPGPVTPQEESLPRAIRLIDVDADGLPDRLDLGADGSLSISLNRGARQFEPIAQELPTVLVADVLVQDLDADGHADLYLVSPAANLALAGDGTGRFVDKTVELGLEDEGFGLSAENADLDADGLLDLLLHNRSGDVIFWAAEGGGFVRDAATPPVVTVVASPAVTPNVNPDTGPLANDQLPPVAGLSAGGRTLGGSSGPGSGPGGRIPVSAPPSVDPDIEPAIELPTCATTIRDQSTGDCIFASSIPTLGNLYPLSSYFNMDAAGNVGMGTTSPLAPLHIQRGAERLYIMPNSPPNYVTLSAPGSHLLFDSGGDAEVDLFGPGNSFAVTQGGVDRFFVSGTGNVGIGTSSPLAPFHIQSGSESLRITPNSPANYVTVSTPGSHLRLDSGGDAEVDLFGNASFFRVMRAGAERFSVQGTGDVSQVPAGNGLVKAGCRVDGVTPSLVQQFNVIPGAGAVTLTRLGTGRYRLDFGVDVSARILQATLEDVAGQALNLRVRPDATDVNSVRVSIYNLSGNSIDGYFYLSVL